MKKKIIMIGMVFGCIGSIYAIPVKMKIASALDNVCATYDIKNIKVDTNKKEILKWINSKINKVNFIKYEYSGTVNIKIYRTYNNLNVLVECENKNLVKDIENILVDNFPLHYLNEGESLIIPVKFILYE